MPPLKNAQEEIFAREYARHGHGERAVIAAGYKAKTWLQDGSKSASAQASKHLTNSRIQFRIQELQEQKARRADVSDVYVLTKLKTIVQRCMQEVRPILARGENGRMEPTGEFEFDSMGANKALNLIGDYLGMFDKVPQQPTSQVTNQTLIQFYMPTNDRIHEARPNGHASNGSQGEGSPSATPRGTAGSSVISLPSNGQH